MDSKNFTSQLAKRLNADGKLVANMIEALSAVLSARLADEDAVAIPGFGNFTAKKVDERIVVDNATGQRMLVPPQIKIDFLAGAMLKKQIENE